PFYLIATDAKKETFEEKGKPIYEDYLQQNGVGALYLNLNDATDGDIEEINQYSSPTNSQGTGASYDARGDGMVLVRNGEIEKLSTRHALNENVYERDGLDILHEEIKENVEKTVNN